MDEFRVEDIIRRAVKNIPANYSTRPTTVLGFYRESLKKLSECVDMMNEQKVDFLIELGDLIGRELHEARVMTHVAVGQGDVIDGVARRSLPVGRLPGQMGHLCLHVRRDVRQQGGSVVHDNRHA